MGDGFGNKPVEIVPGVPKDAVPLRKDLFKYVSENFGKGATPYGGNLNAGVDQLTQRSNNILMSLMGGGAWGQGAATGGGGTGGSGRTGGTGGRTWQQGGGLGSPAGTTSGGMNPGGGAVGRGGLMPPGSYMGMPPAGAPWQIRGGGGREIMQGVPTTGDYGGMGYLVELLKRMQNTQMGNQ